MSKSQISKLDIQKQTGFNLIELLVVISIIALLVTAALLIFNSSRQKSRDARRVADVKQIISALDLYFNVCNSYPIPSSPNFIINSNYSLYSSTGSVVGPCGTNAAGPSSQNGGFGLSANAAGTIFVRTLQGAPSPADGSTCATGTNNSYTYNATGVSGTSASGYTIQFCLGSATGGYSANLNTITR